MEAWEREGEGGRVREGETLKTVREREQRAGRSAGGRHHHAHRFCASGERGPGGGLAAVPAHLQHFCHGPLLSHGRHLLEPAGDPAPSPIIPFPLPHLYCVCVGGGERACVRVRARACSRTTRIGGRIQAFLQGCTCMSLPQTCIQWRSGSLLRSLKAVALHLDSLAGRAGRHKWGVRMGQVSEDMGKLVEQGVTSFKFFLAYKGVFQVTDHDFLHAISRAKQLGALSMVRPPSLPPPPLLPLTSFFFTLNPEPPFSLTSILSTSKSKS